MKRIAYLFCILVIGGTVFAYAQTPDSAKTAEKPILYVVGTSHLDTQWRWHIRTTIDEYNPATFADNFRLMDLYPNYRFSYEGSFRYGLLKEYQPELWNRLKGYVASGQWRPTGSWVDAVDVNIPSPESLVRHTLYGNGFFKREFGVTSRDIFLPDCFGFGFALPSIATHCGLKSFSTQKLPWGSWVGIPFDIGIWEGVDGSSLVAALNPGDYVSQIEDDLTRDTFWINTAERQQKASGLAAAYRYFGTGDTGGAPDSASVAKLALSQTSDGPLKVVSVGADDLVDLVAGTDRSKLPRYRGELLMTRHGVGCYTSQSAMKRWNRKNELLADAAERASIIASRLGGMAYPTDDFRDIWTRFLWHQFHDDLTGTSIPEAYEFSWNDEILCLNRSSGILEHAAEAMSPALDTRASGIPVLVYNSLAAEREDIVDASVSFPAGVPVAVRVYGPDGVETPSQIVGKSGNTLHLLFLATVPSVGVAVYDVRPTQAGYASDGLSASADMLENGRYRVRIDENGDVASITDKHAGRELLARPIQHELLFNKPNAWPAWEIDYDEVEAPARSVVAGPVQVEITEDGPVRVTLRITRKLGQSTFQSTISLAAGAPGDRVVFDSEIDWFERETLLKVAFHPTTPNEHVTYDLGLGTIQRGQNHPKLYEVPGHQWADMTSTRGEYGVAFLSDCKYGWDHPDSSTLRLTLIHTPGVYDSWSWVEDQRSIDNGHHRHGFAVTGHQGDWREGGVVWQGACFNQPLIAFQTESHPGVSGKRYSLVSVESSESRNRSHPTIMLNALKKAEDSDEIVIRLRETEGCAAPDVKVHFSETVLAAREINGAEEPIGPATIEAGALTTSLGSYQFRAFAISLPDVEGIPPESRPIALPFELDGISLDADRRDGDLERGYTLSGDLLPDTLIHHDIAFVFGPKTPGALNVVRCDGQSLSIEPGSFDHLYMLCASVGGPAQGTFSVGGRDTTIRVQDYAQPIAQWNNRMVAGTFVEEPELIAPAYINRQPVAWYASHRHSPDGQNEAYQFTYLYLIRVEIPSQATAVTLPREPRIRLFAATLANTPYDDTRLVQPLYDVTNTTLPRVIAKRKSFTDSLIVSLSSPSPGAMIHFTTDGTEPTARSPLYAGPITITRTTELKARALLAGADDSYVATATYSLLPLREPSIVDGAKPGLKCTYYEGSWDKLPDFDTMKVKKSAVVDSVVIPAFARDEDYGVVLNGFITVPSDGLYDFAIGSDDGSDLRIGDTLLVDNDGLHGMGDVEGGIGLKAGTHRLAIRMFQKKGGEGLRLLVEGPGIPRQIVPESWYSHTQRKGLRAKK